MANSKRKHRGRPYSGAQDVAVQRGIERRNRLRFGPFDLAPLDLEGPNPIEVARGAYRGARRFGQDPRNALLYDPTTAERYDPRRVFEDEPYSVPEVVVTAPRPSLGRRAHALGEDAFSAARAAPGAIVDLARAPFRQFEQDSRQLDRARFRFKSKPMRRLLRVIGNDGATSDAALGAFSSGALAASEFLPGGMTAARNTVQRRALAAEPPLGDVGGMVEQNSRRRRTNYGMPLAVAGAGAGAFALPRDADAQTVSGDPIYPVPSNVREFAQEGDWVGSGEDIDGEEFGLPKGPRYRIETLRIGNRSYQMVMSYEGPNGKALGVIGEPYEAAEEDAALVRKGARPMFVRGGRGDDALFGGPGGDRLGERPSFYMPDEQATLPLSGWRAAQEEQPRPPLRRAPTPLPPPEVIAELEAEQSDMLASEGARREAESDRASGLLGMIVKPAMRLATDPSRRRLALEGTLGQIKMPLPDWAREEQRRRASDLTDSTPLRGFTVTPDPEALAAVRRRKRFQEDAIQQELARVRDPLRSIATAGSGQYGAPIDGQLIAGSRAPEMAAGFAMGLMPAGPGSVPDSIWNNFVDAETSRRRALTPYTTPQQANRLNEEAAEAYGQAAFDTALSAGAMAVPPLRGAGSAAKSALAAQSAPRRQRGPVARPALASARRRDLALATAAGGGAGLTGAGLLYAQNAEAEETSEIAAERARIEQLDREIAQLERDRDKYEGLHERTRAEILTAQQALQAEGLYLRTRTGEPVIPDGEYGDGTSSAVEQWKAKKEGQIGGKQTERAEARQRLNQMLADAVGERNRANPYWNTARSIALLAAYPIGMAAGHGFRRPFLEHNAKVVTARNAAANARISTRPVRTATPADIQANIQEAGTLNDFYLQGESRGAPLIMDHRAPHGYRPHIPGVDRPAVRPLHKLYPPTEWRLADRFGTTEAVLLGAGGFDWWYFNDIVLPAAREELAAAQEDYNNNKQSDDARIRLENAKNDVYFAEGMLRFGQGVILGTAVDASVRPYLRAKPDVGRAQARAAILARAATGQPLPPPAPAPRPPSPSPTPPSPTPPSPTPRAPAPTPSPTPRAPAPTPAPTPRAPAPTPRAPRQRQRQQKLPPPRIIGGQTLEDRIQRGDIVGGPITHFRARPYQGGYSMHDLQRAAHVLGMKTDGSREQLEKRLANRVLNQADAATILKGAGLGGIAVAVLSGAMFGREAEAGLP